MSLSNPKLKHGVPLGLKYPQIVPLPGSNSVSYCVFLFP